MPLSTFFVTYGAPKSSVSLGISAQRPPFEGKLKEMDGNV